MALIGIVIGLALIEYFATVFLCGRARVRYSIAAPATTGDPMFERYFRVQQNSMEQLVIFVPGIALFGSYVSEPIGAGLGLVFILGRALYARGYYLDPPKRGLGFGLSVLANLGLAFGGLVGALVAYF
jgi:glutathione S-transferase